jgi:phosphatidylglycerophosphate synthase
MSTQRRYSYERSLKSDAADELINVYLLRPIAGVFVRIIYITPLTPNHVTISAIVAGAIAASLYVLNSPLATMYAGLSLTLKDVLDSADGQLARAKQMYSRAGRFLDSVGDFAVNLLVFTAITWALTTSSRSPFMPALGLLGFLGISLRVSYHVFYHVAYLHTENRYTQNRLIEEFREEDRVADRRTRRLQSLYLILYGWQDRLMLRIDKWCRNNASSSPKEDEGWYGDAVGFRISGFIGMGTELLVLMLFSVIGSLELYLWFNLLVMNAVWVGCVCYRRFMLAPRLLKDSHGGSYFRS